MNQYASRVFLSVVLLAVPAGCGKATAAPDRIPAPVTSAHGASPSSSAAEASLESIEIAGDLRPVQAANLSFKVGGRLASLRVARGEHVKTGQVLASLSDVEARATVAQADAAVRVARAQAALAEDAEKRVS